MVFPITKQKKDSTSKFLIHALKNRGLSKGVASLCIGGGEAVAMAVEAI